VQPLINALNDGSENVRVNAAWALGYIKSETAVQPLINALNDGSENVRNYAVRALGNIKPETAVQPLINALKDESENVRNYAVRAIFNIKSETAVQPLINALNDENIALNDEDIVVFRVKCCAAMALGNIKSETAVQPLINALNDKDLSIRHIAANELANICTVVKNKKLLRDLLRTENELYVNTAFEILDKIEKEERSKIVLFEKKPPYRMKEVCSDKKSQKIEHIRPATEGLKDAYFGAFVDKLKSVTEPITIIDYGCGEGKFLCTLKTLSEGVLRKILYIGVDISTKCRYISRLTAEKYGLTKELKNEPEFLKPEAFFKKDITVDYIFFMHVLHEIELVYLVDIIYLLSSKVKNGGKIFILDQKKLVEEERSFILWDDEKDFEMLFQDSGFKPFVRYFTTGSGKQLSSIEIEKVKNKHFTKEDAGRNCLAVYKAKQAKLMEKRKQSGLNDEKYSEISIQYANISEQIDEYERTIQSEITRSSLNYQSFQQSSIIMRISKLTSENFTALSL